MLVQLTDVESKMWMGGVRKPDLALSSCILFECIEVLLKCTYIEEHPITCRNELLGDARLALYRGLLLLHQFGDLLPLVKRFILDINQHSAM